MKSFFKKFTYTLIFLLVIGGGTYVMVNYYYLIFAKTVVGKVIKVSRVNDTIAVMGNGGPPNSAVYSFAVAIKTADGTIFTSSTEDRQWAAVSDGNCVEAKLYPYPPWNFEKADTFFNARLIHMMDCK